ncbi:hypothetical protein T439DRAFT_320328 [Meredithblackwellia eburnea MCA 4105]
MPLSSWFGRKEKAHCPLIAKLPPTLLLRIFTFASSSPNPYYAEVDYATLSAAALVCRSWRDMAQEAMSRHVLFVGRKGEAKARALCRNKKIKTIYHLELHGIQMPPFDLMARCEGIRQVTLKDTRNLTNGVLLNRYFDGLKVLHVQQVTFGEDLGGMPVPPCRIQLSHLATDLFSESKVIKTIFKSSAETLSSLDLYIANAGVQTPAMVQLFAELGAPLPALQTLSFSGKVPTSQAHSTIGSLLTLKTVALNLSELPEEYPTILPDFLSCLPPSVNRITLTQHSPEKVFEALTAAFKKWEKSKGLTQVDFPHLTRSDVGESVSGQSLLNLLRSLGAKVAFREDLL